MIVTKSFFGPLLAQWPMRAILTGHGEIKMPCALTAVDARTFYLDRTIRAVEWLGVENLTEPGYGDTLRTSNANGWAETWPYLPYDLSLLGAVGNQGPIDVGMAAHYVARQTTVSATHHVERTVTIDNGKTRIGVWNCDVTLYRGRKLARVQAWLDIKEWPKGFAIEKLWAGIRNSITERMLVLIVDAELKKQTAQFSGVTTGNNRVYLVDKNGDPPGIRNAKEFVLFGHWQPACGLGSLYSAHQQAYYTSHRTEFPDEFESMVHLSSGAESWKSFAISTEYYVVGMEFGDKAGYWLFTPETALRDFRPTFIPNRKPPAIESALTAKLKWLLIEEVERRGNRPPYHPDLLPDHEGPPQPITYRFGAVWWHYWPSQVLEFAVHTGDPDLLRLSRRIVDQGLNLYWQHLSKRFKGSIYPGKGSFHRFIEDPSVLLLAWLYFGDTRARKVWDDYWFSIVNQEQIETSRRSKHQTLCNLLIALDSKTFPETLEAKLVGLAQSYFEQVVSDPFEPTPGGDTTQFWDGRLPLLWRSTKRWLGEENSGRLTEWVLGMEAHPLKHKCGHDETHTLGLDIFLGRARNDRTYLTRSLPAVRRFLALDHKYYHYYLLSQVWQLWPHLVREVEEEFPGMLKELESA